MNEKHCFELYKNNYLQLHLEGVYYFSIHKTKLKCGVVNNELFPLNGILALFRELTI